MLFFFNLIWVFNLELIRICNILIHFCTYCSFLLFFKILTFLNPLSRLCFHLKTLIGLIRYYLIFVYFCFCFFKTILSCGSFTYNAIKRIINENCELLSQDALNLIWFLLLFIGLHWILIIAIWFKNYAVCLRCLHFYILLL